MKFNQAMFKMFLQTTQQEKELSLRSAAKEIGISPATLSRLHNKLYVPDVNTFFLCCQWVQIDMEIFFMN